jgi:hypothetical protein
MSSWCFLVVPQDSESIIKKQIIKNNQIIKLMFYFLPSSFIPLPIYFILGSIFLIKKKKDKKWKFIIFF